MIDFLNTLDANRTVSFYYKDELRVVEVEGLLWNKDHWLLGGYEIQKDDLKKDPEYKRYRLDEMEDLEKYENGDETQFIVTLNSVEVINNEGNSLQLRYYPNFPNSVFLNGVEIQSPYEFFETLQSHLYDN